MPTAALPRFLFVAERGHDRNGERACFAAHSGGHGEPAASNRNYTALDLTGAYGGGLYGICYGLALSAGTGLTLNIASGHAL